MQQHDTNWVNKKKFRLFCHVHGRWGAVCTFSADLQTSAPTCAVQNAVSKPFRQLATNRCLRGFINMSGIDTTFESAYKPQTTWKTAQSLISTAQISLFSMPGGHHVQSDSHLHTLCAFAPNLRSKRSSELWIRVRQACWGPAQPPLWYSCCKLDHWEHQLPWGIHHWNNVWNLLRLWLLLKVLCCRIHTCAICNATFFNHCLLNF